MSFQTLFRDMENMPVVFGVVRENASYYFREGNNSPRIREITEDFVTA